MIIIAIQLKSSFDLTFAQIAGTIGWAFPSAVTVDSDSHAGDQSAVVRVTLDQGALTYDQRNWLNTSAFSARYIDSYEVPPAVDIWQVHKDNEAAFLCVLLNTYAAMCEIDDNDEVVALAFERIKELGWVLIADEQDTFSIARQAAEDAPEMSVEERLHALGY